MEDQTVAAIGGPLSRRNIVGRAGGGVTVGTLVALGLPASTRLVAAQDEAAAMLDAWAAAWSSGNVDRVTSVFAADGIYEDVPSETVVQGAAEIAAWAQSDFETVTEITQSIESWAAIPTGAMVQWRVDATHPTAGTMAAFRGVSLLELAEGKIAREIAYYDNATYIRQAGDICEAPAPDGTPAATPEGGTP